MTRNQAPPGKGGGIYNDGTVTLTGSSITSNLTSNCSPLMSVAGGTG